MATQTYDTYGRDASGDQGSPFPPGAPVAGTGNGSPLQVHRVTQTAGSGTSANISITAGYKCRVVDFYVLVTSGVASSTVQLFTATGGGGTAASSALSTASTGKVRDSLTTASQVFALGATIFLYASAGATLAGFEAFVVTCPEQ